MILIKGINIAGLYLNCIDKQENLNLLYPNLLYRCIFAFLFQISGSKLWSFTFIPATSHRDPIIRYSPIFSLWYHILSTLHKCCGNIRVTIFCLVYWCTSELDTFNIRRSFGHPKLDDLYIGFWNIKMIQWVHCMSVFHYTACKTTRK